MNQRSGHDLTDTIFIAGSVLFAFAGVLYVAGGITSLLSTGEWVTSPWTDALRAPLHPGNPAAAFGKAPSELAPATYWAVFAVLLVVPLALAYTALNVWQSRKAAVVSRTRVLAARPGLASRGEVDAAVGRRQVIRRGCTARPRAPTNSPYAVGTFARALPRP